MKRRFAAGFAATLIAASVVTLVASPASATGEETEGEVTQGRRIGSSEPEQSENGNERIGPSAGATRSWAKWPWSSNCPHQGRHDNPHYSGGDVSVHGWWEEIGSGNDCPERARVWIELWTWACPVPLTACSSSQGGRWVRVDKDGPRLLYEGGGSGPSKRVTARATCLSGDWYDYLIIVDVDIPNRTDSADRVRTYLSIACEADL